MLDLSQNAVIAAIVGPLTVFLLTFVGWALRRLYFKHDEEIKNMAVTQKEIGERLMNVLTEQGKLSDRLEERFNGLSSRMSDFQENVKRVEGNMTEMRSNMDGMRSNMHGMQRDIDGMQRDISGAHTAIQDHRKYVDTEIAGLRKLLDRNGRNGAG